MKRVPTTLYFWVSRLAGFVGIVCMVIAVVTSVTEHHLATDPAEWVQIAIAAFIFAIWAVLYELRDRGIKTS
jgi:magnesium-transporting ATPase (P-type)